MTEILEIFEEKLYSKNVVKLLLRGITRFVCQSFLRKHIERFKISFDALF